MIAIDLGSNTIRFIEFDGKNWGESFEKIVRTAEDLHQTHCIGESAVARIVSAINEAKHILDFSSHEVIGYTTAAMRLASNSDEVLDELYQKSGIVFKIIDSTKEAELTLSAVRYRLTKLSMEPDAFILVDIGGGSTELIYSSHNDVRSVSINTGIVTLSESVASSKTLQDKLDHFKSNVLESLPIASGVQLVLTAGTPTTIAAYLNQMDYTTYDPERINGYVLQLDDCYRVYDELLAMDEVTRSRYVGVGRENLIIAGIKMVCTIYEALETDKAIIIDDGLREGIALEYYK